MNPIKEALAAAGKTCDGHVTHGSLEAQWQVVVNVLAKQNAEICQILGKALGYPLSPGSDTAICVGDHVAESIADEAARYIGQLRNKQ